MDDLVSACFTMEGSEYESVFFYLCWQHFFVAIFTENCVFKYVHFILSVFIMCILAVYTI